MRMHAAVGTATVLSLATLVTNAGAQPVPLQQINVRVHVDSGEVVNTDTRQATIFRTVVEVPDSAWIRLTFDEARLGGSTVLKLTSLADGAVQHLTRKTLQQWNNTSAYFNGDAVRIELVAEPGDEASRVTIESVLAGPNSNLPLPSQCGPTDDRMPSNDPRVARSSPVGCTVWMINDAANCFMTAGHCYSVSGMQVCEFNVPESNSNGSWNHPPPSDQYVVDHSSAQWINGGIGNDFCYFGCFFNSETGLTPFQAQGAAFDLARTPPPVSGQTIRVTGYGTDSSPPEWNQIQQTHTGPYVAFFGTTIQYQVDTQGGNSGSPVINEDTGQAIGVHTHAGCNAGGGANQGTGSNLGSWHNALDNPQGVCVPVPGLNFGFPNGLPEFLDPAGDSILVAITGVAGAELEPGTAMLHYTGDMGFDVAAMEPLGGDLFNAVFPALPCGQVVRYYFSAETTEGELILNPLLAPAVVYSAVSGVSQESVFMDNFEADLGWSVTADGGLTDGQWERAVPLPNTVCDRGNPDADADGSGMCYVTDNDPSSCNSDVDGGATVLTSPVLDPGSGGTAFISYWRWYDNTGGGSGTNPGEDVMVVEVSGDGGASWAPLETVGPTGPEAEGGWYFQSLPIEDYVKLTGGFRIRFTVADLNLASVIEAGVDGVALLQIDCTAVPGDLDGDGIVGINDFLQLLADWGPCDAPCPPSCAADLDDDCTVGITDFLLLLENWTL